MARAPFDLSDFLPYRLAVLSERISKRLAAVYGESFGLSMPEWRVMVHLSRCERVSVREIHHCVNLEKPRVSRAVSRLEAAGLVRKEAGRVDQRLVEISLTAAGTKLLGEAVAAVQLVEARLLAGFEAGELDAFVAMLERLHAVLDADPDAAPRSRMDAAGSLPKATG